MRKLLLLAIVGGVLWTWCGRPAGRARLPASTRRAIEQRLDGAPLPTLGRYEAAVALINEDGTARWLNDLRAHDAAPDRPMPTKLRAALAGPVIARLAALVRERAPGGTAAPPMIYDLSIVGRLVLGRARLLAEEGDHAAAARDALAVARMGQDMARENLLGASVGAEVEARALDVLADAAPHLDRDARRELGADVDALIASAPTARDTLLAESAALDRAILDADTHGRDVDLWKRHAPSLASLAALNERLRARWLDVRDAARIPDACAAQLGDERFCRAAAEVAIRRADNLAQLRKVARALERY